MSCVVSLRCRVCDGDVRTDPLPTLPTRVHCDECGASNDLGKLDVFVDEVSEE